MLRTVAYPSRTGKRRISASGEPLVYYIARIEISRERPLLCVLGRTARDGIDKPECGRCRSPAEETIRKLDYAIWAGYVEARVSALLLSDAWRIRGSRSRDVPIEPRRRDAEPLRDLSYSDVGIGEHRLGGLDVVVGEFRRSASRAAYTPQWRPGPLGCAPASGFARILPVCGPTM
jgi:hypothetical protein